MIRSIVDCGAFGGSIEAFDLNELDKACDHVARRFGLAYDAEKRVTDFWFFIDYPVPGVANSVTLKKVTWNERRHELDEELEAIKSRAMAEEAYAREHDRLAIIDAKDRAVDR